MRAVVFFWMMAAWLPAAAQTVSVRFEVKMGYMMQLGKFRKGIDYVDVAGTFNGWNGSNHRLSDPEGDSTYVITIGSFTAGNRIEFKFRINGSWAGTEEFPNSGPNRVYTVQASGNTIQVWYNDQEPRIGPPKSALTASSATVFEKGVVYFTDVSKGQTTGRRWYFEGGTPAFSTDSLTAVKYNTPGSYGVTLVSYNAAEKDSAVFPAAVTVQARTPGTAKWWNNTVFYEIFVRSFYDSNGDGIGDLRGIIQKLDYLNDGNPATTTDLGITGIWLMPINPSPSYHGYDVTDYRGIHPQYGTMADFKELLAQAHSRGIKVIVDFVMNHTSDQHVWFTRSAANQSPYRPYYRWSVSNPGAGWYLRNGLYYYGYFWSGMPDLNYDTPAVKDSMFAITDYWLKNVGVDGFRLDAAIHIFEEGNVVANVPKTFTFWQEFNQRVKAANPDAFSVGEAWTSFDYMPEYVKNDRLDYVFEFDVASSVLNAVNSGSADPVLRAVQKSYDTFPFLQFGTFLTNHDQNRVADMLGFSVPKMKAAASIYLTLPGIPYLYYGEEVAMRGVKPDEDIRRPMQWTAGSQAGFTTGVPWRAPQANYTQSNVAGMQADTTSLWHHYRKLIQLRNRLEPLRTGPFEPLISSRKEMLAFRREGRGEGGFPAPVIVLVNTSGTTLTNVSLQPGNVNFCGDARSGGCNQFWRDEYAGRDYIYLNNPSWSISLAPYETRVLRLTTFSLSSDDPGKPAQAFTLDGNYPNPFNPSTIVRFTLPAAGEVTLEVTDLSGRRVERQTVRMEAGARQITVRLDRAASGVYLYRLSWMGQQRTGKMALVK